MPCRLSLSFSSLLASLVVILLCSSPFTCLIDSSNIPFPEPEAAETIKIARLFLYWVLLIIFMKTRLSIFIACLNHFQTDMQNYDSKLLVTNSDILSVYDVLISLILIISAFSGIFSQEYIVPNHRLTSPMYSNNLKAIHYFCCTT